MKSGCPPRCCGVGKARDASWSNPGAAPSVARLSAGAASSTGIALSDSIDAPRSAAQGRDRAATGGLRASEPLPRATGTRGHAPPGAALTAPDRARTVRQGRSGNDAELQNRVVSTRFARFDSTGNTLPNRERACTAHSIDLQVPSPPMRRLEQQVASPASAAPNSSPTTAPARRE